MIPVAEVYQDVIEKVAEEQNGAVNYTRFNRLSKLAELKLLDYLTGDVEGVLPPEPYDTQKIKDFLQKFIVPYVANTNSGKIDKPSDYYGYETLYLVGSYKDDLCAETPVITGDKTPVELVNSKEFDQRTNSFIKGVKPSMKYPIAKLVNDTFVFSPSDLGTVILEYRRLPKFAEVKSTIDQEYNEEVIDESGSTNYEWPEGVRNLLVLFICQAYGVRTREDALQQQLVVEERSPRQ